jgi:carboxyl-terminal processing protease
MRHLTRISRRSATFIALGVALAACGVADGDPTPTPSPTSTAVATATPIGPAATATPDLEVLLKDGGIAVIQIAYDRLLDQYIDPLEPVGLLSAAWDAMASEAQAEGLSPPGKPSFGGTRDDVLAAFAQAYVPFANAVDDPTDLRYAAIRGMAASLRDCHTFFLNPVASDTLIGERAGTGSVGIGVELAGVPPLVTEVYPNGPAARAGVLVGDRIAAVDGADASGFGPAATFEVINGDEGTSVTIALRRAGAPAPVVVTVARERVVPPNVESRVMPGAIGYVRIRHFTDLGVKADLQNALQAFDRAGVTSWIIDLRGNPGGRLDTPAISLFVRDGVVVRSRARGGALEEERATGDLLTTIRPTVLLTNNRTGSVSEIFAAALKEYEVARIVGTNTNGCVGYTDVRELGDGSSLAVTTHVHLGPISSRELNGVGVQPDLVIGRSENDIANARDPQLDAAVGLLQP